MLQLLPVYGMAGITLFAIALICIRKRNNHWLLFLKVMLFAAVAAFGILTLFFADEPNLPDWYYPVYRVWLPTALLTALFMALEAIIGSGAHPHRRGYDPSGGEDPGLKYV